MALPLPVSLGPVGGRPEPGLPLTDPVTLGLPPLAEVHQPSAPNQHRRLSVGPGRTIAVPREERVQRAYLCRVVHPNDPLAPGQVLDPMTGVSPLPVEDSGDLQGLRVEQEVVRAEIPMHEDLAGFRPRPRQYLGQRQLMDPREDASTGMEHVRCPAGVHQVLTVRAMHEPEPDLAPEPRLMARSEVHVVQYWWDRQQPLQTPENRTFELPANLRLRPGVPLDDNDPVAGRVVGVPVRHPLHDHSLTVELGRTTGIGAGKGSRAAARAGSGRGRCDIGCLSHAIGLTPTCFSLEPGSRCPRPTTFIALRIGPLAQYSAARPAAPPAPPVPHPNGPPPTTLGDSGKGNGHAPRPFAALVESFTRDVEVTRRLYRSGESEYLIDGEVCRLRDVHELLMDTGLGAKAYAIIEQGKIGLILSSRPADRRMLIEEAAGIGKYKTRKRLAE